MHSNHPDPTHSKHSLEPRRNDAARLLKRRPARWLPLAGLWLSVTVLFAAIAFVVERASAQVPQPGLTVALSGTNLLIVITNGSSLVSYQIDRTPILGDEDFPWTYYTNGALGQTSFVAGFGIETRGYFRAAVGSDFDSDGVPNTIDGQPNNSSVGALTITIDSPLNGTNIQ